MTQYERIARLEVALKLRDQRQRRLLLTSSLVIIAVGLSVAAVLAM
jgi:hypothetical protein